MIFNIPWSKRASGIYSENSTLSFVMSQINFDTVNKSENQETKYSRSSLLPQRALSYNMAVYVGEQHFKIKLDVLIYLTTKVILSINLNRIKDRTQYSVKNRVILVNPVWLRCSTYCFIQVCSLFPSFFK